ncbi:acyl carrier protein [Nonomuraea sp. K274]|uniref:Acyl carrier protein n=1 Tax=Nonomuraea cypriaca TaxID=1187855 RepID=A0A931EWU4_9ACTN|nr:acyl carrier protein [Nonomuraea cypriaca]MBF8187069.1 acyl carrier protein [Nonomuraea cypriaca]
MTVLAEVRRFVHENSGNDSVPDDDDMFATGYVNSLFAIQLVMWLEQRYGVEVTGADLDIANFRSISDVAALANRLAGGPVEVGH